MPAALLEDAAVDEVLELPEVPEEPELLVAVPLDLVPDDPVEEALLPLGDPVETVPLVPGVFFPPEAPPTELEGTTAKVVLRPAGMPDGPVGLKLAGVVIGRL